MHQCSTKLAAMGLMQEFVLLLTISLGRPRCTLCFHPLLFQMTLSQTNCCGVERERK